MRQLMNVGTYYPDCISNPPALRSLPSALLQGNGIDLIVGVTTVILRWCSQNQQQQNI